MVLFLKNFKVIHFLNTQKKPNIIYKINIKKFETYKYYKTILVSFNILNIKIKGPNKTQIKK